MVDHHIANRNKLRHFKMKIVSTMSHSDWTDFLGEPSFHLVVTEHPRDCM